MATLNCFQTNPAAFATPASSLAYVQQASDADPANGFYVRCDLIVQCLNTRQGLFPAPLLMNRAQNTTLTRYECVGVRMVHGNQRTCGIEFMCRPQGDETAPPINHIQLSTLWLKQYIDHHPKLSKPKNGKRKCFPTPNAWVDVMLGIPTNTEVRFCPLNFVVNRTLRNRRTPATDHIQQTAHYVYCLANDLPSSPKPAIQCRSTQRNWIRDVSDDWLVTDMRVSTVSSSRVKATKSTKSTKARRKRKTPESGLACSRQAENTACQPGHSGSAAKRLSQAAPLAVPPPEPGFCVGRLDSPKALGSFPVGNLLDGMDASTPSLLDDVPMSLLDDSVPGLKFNEPLLDLCASEPDGPDGPDGLDKLHEWVPGPLILSPQAHSEHPGLETPMMPIIHSPVPGKRRLFPELELPLTPLM